MTARQTEERKRKRLRREAQEQAWREWANGGPLMDTFAPIMQGAMTDAEYAEFVRREQERRSEVMRQESYRLAWAFAMGCEPRHPNLVIDNAFGQKRNLWIADSRVHMYTDFRDLEASVGPPGVAATHSTDRLVPTTSGTTIPRL
jgi:hypothetical protein